jgi:hypothetical protein
MFLITSRIMLLLQSASLQRNWSFFVAVSIGHLVLSYYKLT